VPNRAELQRWGLHYSSSPPSPPQPVERGERPKEKAKPECLGRVERLWVCEILQEDSREIVVCGDESNICRQAAIKVNWIDLLLVCCNALLGGESNGWGVNRAETRRRS
jgi:hypothetical protein